MKGFSLFGVEELDWPAQSPDLNPIRHNLVAEWEQIPAARFQNVVENPLRIAEAVIAAF